MDWLKLINVLGIALQIVGVCALAGSDLLARRIDAAFESIPTNLYVDILEKGGERAISPEEREYQRLDAKHGAHKALCVFRISLGLVVAGMLLQLLVAVCS